MRLLGGRIGGGVCFSFSSAATPFHARSPLPRPCPAPPSRRRHRYTTRGFGLSYISHFTGMPTGDVVAHVVEGKTAKISVVSASEQASKSERACEQTRGGDQLIEEVIASLV